MTAENLAERYRAERLTDPEKAEITRVTDVIDFVLKAQGHTWADHAKQVRNAGYDVHSALRHLPNGKAAAEAAARITDHATPLCWHISRQMEARCWTGTSPPRSGDLFHKTVR